MKKTSLWLVAALAASSACTKPSGNQAGSGDAAKLQELEERIKKLEAAQQGYGEVAEFVRPIMQQQKAEQAARAAREPDPTVRFAVSVEGNEYDGPAKAAVTVIEAWDFA